MPTLEDKIIVFLVQEMGMAPSKDSLNTVMAGILVEAITKWENVRDHYIELWEE